MQEPPHLWIERAPARLKDRAPRVEHRDNGDWWVFDDGKAAQPLGLTASAGRSVVEYRRDGVRHDELRPGMSEPKPRLADLDADGVYAQVLYPSVTLGGAKTYSDDRELQVFCVRSYNEWITEFCAGGAGRLFAQAIVPTTGIDDAVAELEWAIEHDHRGVVISRFPNGDFEVEPEDHRFFGLAEEAGMPVAVHIGSFLKSNPNHKWRSPDDLRYLGDTGASKSGGHTLPVACDILFSGIFEEFPALKVVLVESNIGWIPTMLEQCDDMFLRYRWFTGAVEKMSQDAERDLLAELLGHVHGRYRRPRAAAPPQPGSHHVVDRLPALGHRLAELAASRWTASSAVCRSITCASSCTRTRVTSTGSRSRAPRPPRRDADACDRRRSSPAGSRSPSARAGTPAATGWPTCTSPRCCRTRPTTWDAPRVELELDRSGWRAPAPRGSASCPTAGCSRCRASTPPCCVVRPTATSWCTPICVT